MRHLSNCYCKVGHQQREGGTGRLLLHWAVHDGERSWWCSNLMTISTICK